MELEEVIRKRESTRLFSSKEVEQEKLDKILEAARLAPTAKNVQPIKILIVRSKEGLKIIDKVSPCRYKAPVVLLIYGDKSKAYSKTDFTSYEMDATIVATHMMLEATNIGVDNIWIEMFNTEKTKELFGLEDNWIPIAMMPIGYRSKLCPPSIWHKKRKKIEDIVEYR